MNCKERLEQYLRDNQVSFKEQEHALAYTTQEVAQREHIPGKMVAKVVIALADGKKVMVVLPASYRADLGKVRAALGAKDVALANESDFAADFPDCEVGAMPPFGNLYGMPVYVDNALAEDETIVFNAGTHTDTMSVRYADFARLAQPAVVDLSQAP